MVVLYLNTWRNLSMTGITTCNSMQRLVIKFTCWMTVKPEENDNVRKAEIKMKEKRARDKMWRKSKKEILHFQPWTVRHWWVHEVHWFPFDNNNNNNNNNSNIALEERLHHSCSCSLCEVKPRGATMQPELVAAEPCQHTSSWAHFVHSDPVIGLKKDITQYWKLQSMQER